MISTEYFNDYSISLDRYPLQPFEHSNVTNNYVSYNTRLKRRGFGSNNVEPACQTNKDQRTSYTTSTLTQEVLPQEATHADDKMQILMIESHVHDGSYPKASNIHKSHNSTSVQQLDFMAKEDR